MSPEQSKRLAYEFTMEYFKQNEYFIGADCTIPNMVNRFGETYIKFLKEISTNQDLWNL